MLVFIDESGCSGFKLARGSDAVFAIGMVLFENADDASCTRRRLSELRKRIAHKPEFKFSKSSDRLRDSFFSAVTDCPFKVRVLVVDKANAAGSSGYDCHDAFFNHFLCQLVRRAASRLESAKLMIDGVGDRHLERALKVSLRRQLGGKISDLRMVDSKHDDLIQLADMCVGAVARSFRSHDQSDRWLRLLAPHIEDIWEFY